MLWKGRMLKTCDRTPKLENFQEDVIMLYSGYLKPVKIQQISFRMILISTIYPFVQHLRLTCECFHLDTTRHKSKPFAEKRKCFPPCNARKRLGDLMLLLSSFSSTWVLAHVVHGPRMCIHPPQKVGLKMYFTATKYFLLQICNKICIIWWITYFLT